MREDGRPLKSRIDGKTTPRCENMSNESLGLEFCKIKVRHILFKKIGWWIFLKKPRLTQPCRNFLIHSLQTVPRPSCHVPRPSCHVPRPSWPCSYRNFICTCHGHPGRAVTETSSARLTQPCHNFLIHSL